MEPPSGRILLFTLEIPSYKSGFSVFKHKQHHNLYIFQNQRAFNLCNFSQATLLTKPNATSFTWYPSRTGFFYFTFNDGSFKACEASQKLAVKVSKSESPPQSSTMAPDLSPTLVPAPAPATGGEVSPSPTFPWPFHPREAASPGPSTDKGGGVMPFINSNPAVPLPTGEVDSATIRPLPTSGAQGQVMIGIFGFQIALHSIALPLLLL
ncbi:early nodulin-like protein 1 [Senna tora]|uniref:Early nodulin-like protein 1 n=1 Tax=Senna tora TaxID=362788 RepID=A0A834W8R3_9FABA|nr:early nodulin-like protein 1 [Senna tora]